MKRALVLTALVAIAAVGGALAYRAAAREQGYRALIASGEAALAAGDPLAAVEDFSGAIAVRPDAMLARLRRGEAYSRRGDLDVAARDFRAAAGLDPTATRPLEALADVLYAQERFQRAADTYAERLRLDDRSAQIRYKLALAEYRSGAIDAALGDARRAAQLDDQMADAYYLAALCERDRGLLDAAATSLQKALDRAPGLLAAREELADLYRQTGDAQGRIAQLQALAALDNRNPERQNEVALALAQSGQTDLAIADLTSRLNPSADQPALNAALGRIWLEIAEGPGEHAEAIGKALEALERAASSLAATSETKALYARALARAGQLEAAEQVFQQAIERYPVEPSAFSQLAAVAGQLGHTATARSALTAYISLRPPDTESAADAARLGALAVSAEAPAEATAWLQRALASQPDDVPTLASMSEAQLLRGDLAGARATLDRALTLDPVSPPLAALNRRLRRAGA